MTSVPWAAARGVAASASSLCLAAHNVQGPDMLLVYKLLLFFLLVGLLSASALQASATFPPQNLHSVPSPAAHARCNSSLFACPNKDVNG